MKIVLLNTTYDRSLASIESIPDIYFHPRELARSLSSETIEVTWLQGFSNEDEIQIDQTSLLTFKSSSFKGGMEDLMTQHVNGASLARIIDRIKPDLVHIFGLLPADILQIAKICEKHKSILSASFHGSKPSHKKEYFDLQKRALNKLSTIVFNTPETIKGP